MPGLDLAVADMQYNKAKRQFAKDLSNADECFCCERTVAQKMLTFVFFSTLRKAVPVGLQEEHDLRQLVVAARGTALFVG